MGIKSSNPLGQQIGGSHYSSMKIQPVTFCMVNNLNYCQSNVIRYICRYQQKGGFSDLLKARHVIDLLITQEYPDEYNMLMGELRE